MFPFESLIIPVLITLAFACGVFVLSRQSNARLADANVQINGLQQQLLVKGEETLKLQAQVAVTQSDLAQSTTFQALAQAAESSIKEQITVMVTDRRELQNKLEISRTELNTVQGQLKHTQAVLAERELDTQKLSQKESVIDQLNLQVSDLKTQLNQEKVERQKDQENLDEKLQLLQSNKAQLSQEFENLSNKIFEEKNKQFKASSQEGLNSLLTPFKDQLEG
ncbi:MAG: DNA recombination protein RmuC, partial [Bermanella sp.]